MPTKARSCRCSELARAAALVGVQDVGSLVQQAAAPDERVDRPDAVQMDQCTWRGNSPMLLGEMGMGQSVPRWHCPPVAHAKSAASGTVVISLRSSSLSNVSR